DKVDSVQLWVVENMMRLPTVERKDDWANIWDLDRTQLTLKPHQQLQTQLSSAREGGLGMPSSSHSAAAAFLGSIAFTLPCILAPGPLNTGLQHGRVMDNLRSLPAVLGLRSALTEVHVEHSVPVEKLKGILPAKWVELGLMAEQAFLALSPQDLRAYLTGIPAGGDESGRVHPRSAVQRSIT
ncbi:unnamed protein product, partial [Chrysoparadoxa australica]